MSDTATPAHVLDMFPEVPAVALCEDNDERYTTRETLDWCKRVAGVEVFDLDVAACAESHCAERYYDKAANGLRRDWFPSGVTRTWCNPPFSTTPEWISAAWDQLCAAPGGVVLAMLLPSNRTEQPWWQNDVEPVRDGRQLKAAPVRLTTHFLPSRVRFSAPGLNGRTIDGSPPFGCVLLVWRVAP